MKQLFLFCTILVTTIFGCSNSTGNVTEVYLNQPTEIKYNFLYTLLGDNSNEKRYIVAECKLVNAGTLQINIKGKEERFNGEGEDFYQLDAKGEIISSSSNDLTVKDPKYSTPDNSFSVDAGDTQTGYLRLRPGVTRIEYRIRDGEDRKTKFAIILKEKN